MGAAGFAGRVNVEEYPVEEYPVAWDKIRQNLQASACILGKSHNLSGHDANAVFLSHQPRAATGYRVHVWTRGTRTGTFFQST